MRRNNCPSIRGLDLFLIHIRADIAIFRLGGYPGTQVNIGQVVKLFYSILARKRQNPINFNQEHYGTGEIGRVNSLGTPWSGAEPSDVRNSRSTGQSSLASKLKPGWEFNQNGFAAHV